MPGTSLHPNKAQCRVQTPAIQSRPCVGFVKTVAARHECYSFLATVATGLATGALSTRGRSGTVIAQGLLPPLSPATQDEVSL